MREKMAEFLAVLSGMRKTIVMFLLVAVGIIFRLTNLIDGEQFVDLLKGTTIAFFSANSIEHIGEAIKTYVNKKGQKVEEVSIGDADVSVDENT